MDKGESQSGMGVVTGESGGQAGSIEVTFDGGSQRKSAPGRGLAAQDPRFQAAWCVQRAG